MKRAFDLVTAIILVTLLTPLFIVIALLIKIDSKGPVFFKQIRVGLNGKEFSIFKFRSMSANDETKGLQITVGHRDPRITKVGYRLRKHKIDELPQLFNIIFGTMSFVGPRPEVPKYVNLYTEEQKKILSVKPGITDIASIEYFNENELLKEVDDPERMYIGKIMPEKLKLNLEYIEKQSFIFDIVLILSTALKVLSR